jgi:PST family polysaccharide transporter
MSKKILLKNTAMLSLMQLAGYIFPLLTFPYLSRILTPEYFGLVSFSNSFIIYFHVLLDFGFVLYGTELCSKYRDNKKELSKVTFGIINSKVILAIIGLIILIVSLIFVKNLGQNSLFILLAYISVFLNVFIPDFLFRGIEKMEAITFRTIISGLIYTISIYLFVKSKQDYLLIPIINGFSILVTIIWTWFYISNNRLIEKCTVSFKYLLNLLRNSWSFFLSRIAVTVFSSTNIFALGIYGLNNSIIGQFSLANNLINIIKSVFTPLADSLYPYMIKEKNYKLIKRILIYSIPIIILFTSILFIFSDLIIFFLGGSGFEGSSKLFKMMLPLVFMALPTYLLGFPILSPIGLANKANYSVILGAIFHGLVIVFMLIFNKISVANIIYLTILTELLILSIRIFEVKRYFKSN